MTLTKARLISNGLILALVAWVVFVLWKIIAGEHETELYKAKSDAEIAALNAKRHVEEESQYRTKRWAFGECHSRGGVPVMGFGPSIACIQSPLFDSWVVGIDDPPGSERNTDGVAKDVVHDEQGKAHCFDVGTNAPWAPIEERPCP